ncbi:hypothetical protein T265_07386 [Opisthorchis viverrini]|uniref:Endonuclease/exonuclease/phosphatase domain-containing protein n=1 Tax=Opisthorchis viverrini TaxID=6198 RepID=A0A075ABR7_OPIVI|nr:hypothetical protein T265_07386 [Opisthorchis viverrini]KER25099.1 hypothetical protein T265_07386 [Opisthorchis viverrini]
MERVSSQIKQIGETADTTHHKDCYAPGLFTQKTPERFIEEKVGSSDSIDGRWFVRRAGQFGCKRVSTNRGNIISALLGGVAVDNHRFIATHPNNALMTSPQLVVKRLNSSYEAQRTNQRAFSGDSCLHMLQTHVIPQLKQHKKSSVVLQQDGAPPHCSNQLCPETTETEGPPEPPGDDTCDAPAADIRSHQTKETLVNIFTTERLLCAVYTSHNPWSPPEEEQMNRTLEQLSFNYHFKHLLLVGDFHAPKASCMELWCIESSGVFTAALIEVVKQSAWTQHVFAPTRYRAGQLPALLDLVITNERHFVDQVTINASLEHDHQCVLNLISSAIGREIPNPKRGFETPAGQNSQECASF